MPDISGIDESLLNGLSEQERKILFDTLSNLSKGDSGLLNKLKYADFDEIPVDVETFQQTQQQIITLLYLRVVLDMILKFHY